MQHLKLRKQCKSHVYWVQNKLDTKFSLKKPYISQPISTLHMAHMYGLKNTEPKRKKRKKSIQPSWSKRILGFIVNGELARAPAGGGRTSKLQAKGRESQQPALLRQRRPWFRSSAASLLPWGSELHLWTASCSTWKTKRWKETSATGSSYSDVKSHSFFLMEDRIFCMEIDDFVCETIWSFSGTIN